MLRHKKIAFPLLMLVVVIVVAVLLLLMRQESAETVKSAKVITLGESVCTMDAPSSNCGSYEVEIVLPDGQRTTYAVAGFSSSDNEQYSKISSDLRYAKDNDTTIDLEVNEKGFITSTQ